MLQRRSMRASQMKQIEHPFAGPRRPWALAGAGAVLVAALAVLAAMLAGVRPLALRQALADAGGDQAALAGAAVLASFLLLAAIERAALTVEGVRLGALRGVLSGFAGSAVGNAVGSGALSGGSVRARLFGLWGVDPELGPLIAQRVDRFSRFGAAWLTALALLAAGPALGWAALPSFLSSAAGALLAAFVMWRLRREEALAIGASVLSGLDWLAGAATLFVLLPQFNPAHFPLFAVVYAAAHALAGATRAPGGLVVFEALMLGAAQVLAPGLGVASVIAALLLYRGLYFLFPLALTGAALAAPRRGGAGPLGRAAQAAANALAPPVFGLLTFGVGGLALLAAATPWGAREADRLQRLLPIDLLNASHFAGAVAGAALMVIGAGLARRYAGAFRLALPVYGAAALALLAEQQIFGAAVLTLLLLALAPRGAAFDRPSSILRMRLSAPWLLVAFTAVLVFGWVGLMAASARDFAAAPWWSFAERGDAARFLRAAGGVAALCLLVLLWQGVRPGRPSPGPVDEHARARAHHVLLHGDAVGPAAWLALVGDKQLLFSASGRSFIQYGEAADFLIAMGEPAGLAEERRALIWRFLELADQFDRRAVLYAVGREAVAELAECGLSAQKVGEAALAPLAGFSLEGPARAKLRHARNKALRDGLGFRMLEPGAFAAHSADLRRVSEAWLARQQGQEKAFSMGPFAPHYLAHTPIAVVEQAGRLIAFASLQPGAGRRIVAVDLMRFSDDAPAGTMDFLFTELLGWAAAAGFEHFDLGMAPLAGIDAHKRAPFASRLSALIYAYGERLYGFEGLRAYKNKFQPVWEPVFLCLEHRQSAAVALSAVAWLTQRGLAGMLRLPRLGEGVRPPARAKQPA